MLKEPDRPAPEPQVLMELGAFSPLVSRTALEVRGLTLTVGGRTLLRDARFAPVSYTHLSQGQHIDGIKGGVEDQAIVFFHHWMATAQQ